MLADFILRHNNYDIIRSIIILIMIIIVKWRKKIEKGEVSVRGARTGRPSPPLKAGNLAGGTLFSLL